MSGKGAGPTEPTNNFTRAQPAISCALSLGHAVARLSLADYPIAAGLYAWWTAALGTGRR